MTEADPPLIPTQYTGTADTTLKDSELHAPSPSRQAPGCQGIDAIARSSLASSRWRGRVRAPMGHGANAGWRTPGGRATTGPATLHGALRVTPTLNKNANNFLEDDTDFLRRAVDAHRDDLGLLPTDRPLAAGFQPSPRVGERPHSGGLGRGSIPRASGLHRRVAVAPQFRHAVVRTRDPQVPAGSRGRGRRRTRPW